jgi:hypothetical protein
VGLGEILVRGEAGELDPSEVRAVLEAARDAGHTGALRPLGFMAERGIGRPPDPDEALALYRAAAPQNPWAARDVGRLIRDDTGRPGAEDEAMRWFRQAAEGGCGWAARDLARLVVKRGGDGRRAALLAYLLAYTTEDDPVLKRVIEEEWSGFSEGECLAVAQALLPERARPATLAEKREALIAMGFADPSEAIVPRDLVGLYRRSRHPISG